MMCDNAPPAAGANFLLDETNHHRPLSIPRSTHRVNGHRCLRPSAGRSGGVPSRIFRSSFCQFRLTGLETCLYYR
jgi:hypothetical protein